MFKRTRVDRTSRIFAWVAGLGAMVVVLIWTIQQSDPAPWLPVTLGALIAMVGLAFLAPMGWGRVVVRTVAVATLGLGMIGLGSFGLSLVLAATILLLSSRGPERTPSTLPAFERTRVDPRFRRFVWGGALAMMVLILITAIRLQTEGTGVAQGEPSLGALVALSALVAIGGLALLDPMGWGRFVMRAVSVAAIGLLFTGLLILYLPLIVVATILVLSSRGPKRTSTRSPSRP